jgi:hypothetical protein
MGWRPPGASPRIWQQVVDEADKFIARRVAGGANPDFAEDDVYNLIIA